MLSGCAYMLYVDPNINISIQYVSTFTCPRSTRVSSGETGKEEIAESIYTDNGYFLSVIRKTDTRLLLSYMLDTAIPIIGNMAFRQLIDFLSPELSFNQLVPKQSVLPIYMCSRKLGTIKTSDTSK